MTNLLLRLRSRHAATLFVVLAALATLVFSRTAQATDASLIVATTAGQLRGVPRPTGGAEFLGIPYAQPPIGDLRWHEPLPPKPWSGIRDANAFGAPCAQPILGDWNRRDAEASKEDCLFLNVITPVWPPAAAPKSSLPVMFWLHGGANVGGTASSSLYKDGTLVNHGVLLVTVNYRLGVFGFLAHPALTHDSAHAASGNYGLMDQVLALHWVIDNIAKFGGDPNNITVFGQSAGSQDTGLLMTSIAKDLFQRAIAESGTSFSPHMPSLPEAEEAGERLATAVKAPAGDAALKFLHQLSVPDLLNGVAAVPEDQLPPIGPDIDGWIIPRSPAITFAFGHESPIPLLFGTTTREFGWNATPDKLRERIQATLGDLAPQALTLYGLAGNGQGTTDPLYGTAADQFAADFAFRCAATTQAQWHSAAHHPTWEYEFEHAIPGQKAAVHSSDLPYVFGFFPKAGNIAGRFNDTDYKLADLIETYWTNFAKTGDPNGPQQPHWPQFNDSETYLRFEQDGSAALRSAPLRKPQCDLYRQMLRERIKPK